MELTRGQIVLWSKLNQDFDDLRKEWVERAKAEKQAELERELEAEGNQVSDRTAAMAMIQGRT